MKETHINFSALRDSRHCDDWSHNVTQVNYNSVFASSTWELQMNLRYTKIV